jgi:hypothetical protein
MGEPLQLQSGAAADDNRKPKQRLHRCDDVIPTQGSPRPTEDAPRMLFEPTGLHIIAAKASGITAGLKPGSIRQQAFGKKALQLV